MSLTDSFFLSSQESTFLPVAFSTGAWSRPGSMATRSSGDFFYFCGGGCGGGASAVVALVFPAFSGPWWLMVVVVVLLLAGFLLQENGAVPTPCRAAGKSASEAVPASLVSSNAKTDSSQAGSVSNGEQREPPAAEAVLASLVSSNAKTDSSQAGSVSNGEQREPPAAEAVPVSFGLSSNATKTDSPQAGSMSNTKQSEPPAAEAVPVSLVSSNATKTDSPQAGSMSNGEQREPPAASAVPVSFGLFSNATKTSSTQAGFEGKDEQRNPPSAAAVPVPVNFRKSIDATKTESLPAGSVSKDARRGESSHADSQPNKAIEIELTKWENEELKRFKKLLGTRLGNKDRRLHDTSASCCICQKTKHEVKWELRASFSHGSLCTGSWCYCCKKAGLKLGTGNQEKVVKSVVSVFEKLKLFSQALREKLLAYNGDVCCCSFCVKERKRIAERPAKRLRTKTSPALCFWKPAWKGAQAQRSCAGTCGTAIGREKANRFGKIGG